MTRCCVIEHWVQLKTDQKLFFNGNYIQIVFFVFRIHFHYVLSYLFGLFGVRTCVKHTLAHIIAKKCNFYLKKQRKTMVLAIFGDFSVFDMTSLTMSMWRHTRYVCTFFGTNGLGRVIAIHQHHTLDVSSIGFQDLGGGIPPGCEMGPKSPALLGLRCSKHCTVNKKKKKKKRLLMFLWMQVHQEKSYINILTSSLPGSSPQLFHDPLLGRE